MATLVRALNEYRVRLQVCAARHAGTVSAYEMARQAALEFNAENAEAE